MKRVFPILLLFFIVACSTTNRKLYSPTYSVTMPKSQSEVAWSRAHAYLSKTLHRGEIPGDNTMIPFKTDDNGYVIWAGRYVIQREFTNNEVIIRILMHFKPSYFNAGVSPSTMRLVEGSEQYMTGFIRYVKTGKSHHMVDEEFPDKKQLQEDYNKMMGRK